MTVFVAFIVGIMLFPLFRFFPLISILFFAVAIIFIGTKKRYVLLLIIPLGFLYSAARFSPDVQSIDVWKKELKLTGRFVPKSSVPSAGSSVKTFDIETAADDESGSEIDDLHDKDINIYTDIDEDPDQEYEVLLKTGADKARRNPRGWGRMKLYGSAEGLRVSGPASFSVTNYFNKWRKRINDCFGPVSERLGSPYIFGNDWRGLLSRG